MRALSLALGVLVMGAVQADPPKPKGRLPDLKAPFTEVVHVKQWSGQKEFEWYKNEPDANAYRAEVKGETQFRLSPEGFGLNGGKLLPKSEITDKDGVVWVVTKFSGPHERRGYSEYVAVVTKKPAKK